MAHVTAPPFPAAAVKTIAAATQGPKRFRPPLLHLILILPPLPPPKNLTLAPGPNFPHNISQLLFYAQGLQTYLVSRGITVYLQTLGTNTTNNSSNGSGSVSAYFGGMADSFLAKGVASVINLNHVLITSPADNVVVIDETCVCHRMCFFYVPGARLITSSIEGCVEAVLTRWAQDVARELAHRPKAAEVLAANPNLVTDHHLARFINDHCPLADLFTLFAQLERQTDKSRQWLQIPSSSTEQSSPSSSPVERGKSPPKQTRAAVGGNPEGDSTAADDVPDVSRSIAPEGDPKSAATTSTEENEQHESYKKRMLASLERGIRELRAKQDWSNISKMSSSGPSAIWLRHSEHRVAQILSAQVLARSLHQNLIATFHLVSTMPLASHASPSSHGMASLWSLKLPPTETHRQRLLCELNNMIARIEELGARLSRPSIHKSRKNDISNFASPWIEYLKTVKDLPALKNIARASERHLKDGEWACSRCMSTNTNGGVECTICRSNSRAADLTCAKIIEGVDKYFDDRIKAEIHLASIQRRKRERESEMRESAARKNASRNRDTKACLTAALGSLSLGPCAKKEASLPAPLPTPLPSYSPQYPSAQTDPPQPPSWSQTKALGGTPNSFSLGPSIGSSQTFSPSASDATSAWLSKQGKNPNAPSFNPRGSSINNPSVLNSTNMGADTQQGNISDNLWAYDASMTSGAGSASRGTPHSAPAGGQKSMYELDQLTSLRALAAASNAANGGPGVATDEAINAVSRFVARKPNSAGRHIF